MPLSNLYLASVIKPNFLPVLAVDIGSKYADSIKIFLVLSEQPLFYPPIIPPNACTHFESAITVIVSSSL